MKKRILIITLSALAALLPVYAGGADTARPQNIILIIGDGMSVNQTLAARVKLAGPDGRLEHEKFPVIGLMSTHSKERLVTDSAAAATAMACGIKTLNGMISVHPDESTAATILEEARDRELSTGLIATSRITHATPAAFATHVKSRRDEAEIARQLVESGVNVLLGGGRDYFLPKSVDGSKRGDGLDLTALAKEKGYIYVEDKAGLERAGSDYLLGLFNMRHLDTEKPEPSLAEMTEKALSILEKNEKGFFLMVEGSQIDWMCHDNDTEGMYDRMKKFNDMVTLAAKYAAAKGNTLVIVTGDHETGGLVINGGKTDGKSPSVSWSTKNHTFSLLPVYAFGPGADIFAGVYDNTDIAEKIRKLGKDGK